MKILGAGRLRMTAGRAAGVTGSSSGFTAPRLSRFGDWGEERDGGLGAFCGGGETAERFWPDFVVGGETAFVGGDAFCASFVPDGGGLPQVKARSLASLSVKEGPLVSDGEIDEVEESRSLDWRGVIGPGTSFRRDAGCSAGRRCSSMRARGACLICVARVWRCLVGTARARFRLCGAKMVGFFFAAGADSSDRGIAGGWNVQEGVLNGSEAPVGFAKTGVKPPIFRSYETYRCFSDGRSRGRRALLGSETILGVSLFRSELMPSIAIFIFSASASSDLWTSSRRSQ